MYPSTRALTPQIKVPFHGAELLLVEHGGQPYTPMKPIVEGMGLDWASQFTKLRANERRWGVVIITIPSNAGAQQYLCIPLRKIFGWLTGIHPGKVKDEIRERVIQYQNECDDVLWKYWTEGTAVNPRTGNARSTSADRADALRYATELVIDRHVPFSAAYRVLRFYVGTPSFRLMTCDQVIRATEFAKRLLAHLDTRADWIIIEKHRSELAGAPEQFSLDLHPRLGPTRN
ncbi:MULTISPECIES: phage antirepressor N-terminal domain-containing protein [Pandoraea]|uniref:phage antirepressor N-terminal domain-containing protein n=1 Tax=Pandoraea TaxID=93217 RepID=UPI001F5D6E81|nr:MULTISPECIES: phage antirepressor N-terminal domain-containing protein [Pandoraea]MCI3206536.1 hypothetical protein [Pandoraea sp. LA3]MDN4584564.1 hypothetical protein [Pandoraea capi]